MRWLHVAHLVLSGAFVDFRNTSAKIQGPFLPGWGIRVEIDITRRSWAINIPDSFGKELAKTCRPLQLLKFAVCVCDLYSCKLLSKVGCSYIECGFTQGLHLTGLGDCNKKSCSILQPCFPKVVLVDVFDTIKEKLSAKVPCESHLVDHFFGVHIVFTSTEQLEVTWMNKQDGSSPRDSHLKGQGHLLYLSGGFGTAPKVKSAFQNISQAPPSILYENPSPGVQDCFKGKKGRNLITKIAFPYTNHVVQDNQSGYEPLNL